MRKSFLFIGLAALLFAVSLPEAYAQRGVRNNRTPTLRDDSRQALRRTNRAIRHAQLAVKSGKNYTGHLGRAVRHQRYARALHVQGRYRAAIHHARYARRLARIAIVNNKQSVPADLDSLNKEDADYASDSPSDTALDADLPAGEVTDQEAADSELPDDAE
ncbi:MAG: hypothetical protein LW884_07505 [Bacteroidetes bacterium]|jgi:hypothetical protein|nr:hypothetical protein [Bacteroidota bacterium]